MLPFLTLDLVLAESFFGAISLIRSVLSSSSFNLSLLTSCCAGNLLVTDVTERYDCDCEIRFVHQGALLL